MRLSAASRHPPTAAQCAITRGLTAAALQLALPAFLDAQGTAGGEALTAQVQSGEWVSSQAPLIVRLSRAPVPGKERVVVTAGARDLTPQLERAGLEWRFDNRGVPLPTGRHALVVTLVRDDSIATELVRQDLRVEGPFGVRERRASRSVEAGLKSRLQNETTPAPTSADRPTYNDYDGQLGLGLQAEGRDFALSFRSAMVGTSHRPHALRFGTRGSKAPLIDLSSFLAQYRSGAAEFSLGHLSAGNQRHLLNGFSSRGAGVRMARPRLDASLTALHGSSLAGWDDALGFTTPDHRILSGTVAMEALRTPGVLRIELSALKGSVLPIAGFNQGAVTDAETSAGTALRVQSTLFSSRLRVEAGYARSTFDNPPDPLLGPVDSLVPVARETRAARYLESSFDVLRTRRLFGSRTASLSLGATHERVAPLYRSVGSYIQSDRLQDRFSARGALAGLTFGLHHAVGNNNVDRIPSILTTRSRQSGADFGAPLGELLGRRSAWLPSFSARLSRNHQLGIRIPTGNGFDPSHAPNQVSDEQTLSLSWQAPRGSLTLQSDRSEQDNRQPGRERADLRSTSRSAQGSATLHRHVSLSADAQWTRAQTLERDVTERIRRLGITGNFFSAGPASLALQFATTKASTPAEQRARDDLQWSAQLALQLSRRAGTTTRAFLRYQAQENSFIDPSVPAPRTLRSYLVDLGLTISLP